MVKGSHHSIETRRLMASKRKGERNGFFGRKHSLETLEKMRQASLRLWLGPSYRKRNYEGRRRYYAERSEAQAQ